MISTKTTGLFEDVVFGKRQNQQKDGF